MYGCTDTLIYLSCISFLHHTLRMHTTPPPLISHLLSSHPHTIVGDVADELSFLYRGKVRLIQVDELRTDQKGETMRLRTGTGIVHAGGLFGDFEFVSHGTRIVR